jgi:ABC-2 type transport system ATP-binding protein
MLLGLVKPTSGTATFAGTRYRDLDRPLSSVGTALEASSFHPGRSARDHLRSLAAAGGIPSSRVDEVLGLTGIAPAANRRVGGYSMGMRQRLGLASAMLGDPGVLVLDEPINGLDPEGIRWIRDWLRMLAREGRTVLVSSHLLSEVQQTVDRVVIISRGRIVHEGSLDTLEATSGVLVDAPDRPALVAALGGRPFTQRADGLVIDGATPAEVGAIALRSGVALSLLVPQRAGLEDVFLELVGSGEAGSGQEGAA